MSQRANHLLKCLTGKLKAQPVWTDQELSELGDALRKRVETKIKTDANLLERCNYLKERVALLKKAEEVLED